MTPTPKEDFRTCRECKIEKSLDNFSTDTSRFLKKKYICKECSKKLNKIHRQNNLERIREIERKSTAKRRLKDPEKMREMVRKSQIKRKLLGLTEKQILRDRIASSVKRLMKRCKLYKAGISWTKYLGYNSEELREHLEKHLPDGYTIEKAISEGFHVDHIIPLKLFNFNSIEDEELKLAWNFENLRLIPEKENLRKNARIYPELIAALNPEYIASLPPYIKKNLNLV